MRDGVCLHGHAERVLYTESITRISGSGRNTAVRRREAGQQRPHVADHAGTGARPRTVEVQLHTATPAM